MKIIKVDLNEYNLLREYFNQIIMPGPVDLQIERSDLLKFYQLQSQDINLFKVLSENQTIEGMFSLLYRKSVINNEEKTIGYLTDLRLKPTREVIQSWANEFLPILKDENQKRDCQYVYTPVFQYLGKLYNTLIRPRGGEVPRFHLLNRFNMVSVFGKWPYAFPPLKTINIRNARDNDIGPLSVYLRKKASSQILNYAYSVELLLYRLKNWPNLKINDFILALDKSNQIIGCVAKWNPHAIQKFKAIKYNGFGTSVYNMLKVGSLIRVTKSLPNIGQELSINYLTHLHSDNPDIFYSLLYKAYEQTPKNEILLYTHFIIDHALRPPKGFMTASLPFALYTILPPDQDLPEYLKMNRMRQAPDFESVLL